MRLYFATSTFVYSSSLVKNDIKNILFAYPYATKSLLEDFDEYISKVNDVNLMIDSGAFSVWTLGKTIDREKYLEYCQMMLKRYKGKCSLVVVNLDVIPGSFGVRPTKDEVEESARQGRDNFLYFKSKGIVTIPVFHQHEDIKWLELMRKDADYIGISPANDIDTLNRIRWMDECYKLLKDSIKTHSFGGISPKILERYPLYSGDSSSWSAHYRWGKGMHFNLKVKPREKIGRMYMTDNEVRKVKELETFITNLWKSRGVIWK